MPAWLPLSDAEQLLCSAAATGSFTDVTSSFDSTAQARALRLRIIQDSGMNESVERQVKHRKQSPGSRLRLPWGTARAGFRALVRGRVRDQVLLPRTPWSPAWAYRSVWPMRAWSIGSNR